MSFARGMMIPAPEHVMVHDRSHRIGVLRRPSILPHLGVVLPVSCPVTNFRFRDPRCNPQGRQQSRCCIVESRKAQGGRFYLFSVAWVPPVLICSYRVYRFSRGLYTRAHLKSLRRSLSCSTSVSCHFAPIISHPHPASLLYLLPGSTTRCSGLTVPLRSGFCSLFLPWISARLDFGGV